MADNSFKIDKGVTLRPQTTAPSGASNGDIYYDSTRSTFVLYNNGQFRDLEKRTDITTAAGMSSTTFTSSVTQSSLIKLTGSTSGQIYGLAAIPDAGSVILYNASTKVQTIRHESTGEATLTNRISTPTGFNFYISPNDSVKLIYDSSLSRWTVLPIIIPKTSTEVQYIGNPIGEYGTAQWTIYQEAAPSAVPNDAGEGVGSPALTLSNITPAIRGRNTIRLSHGASSTLGAGIRTDFTIDPADLAKVLTIDIEYAIGSGTFTAGNNVNLSDMTVWIWDLTNDVLIAPSNVSFASNSSIPDKLSATFQTSYNSTSYRLLIHSSTATTNTFGLDLGSVYVRPCVYVYGSPITDWQSYTPTVSSASGTLTNYVIDYAEWSRSGQNAFYRIKLRFTGAPGTWSEPRFSLPSGHVPTASATGFYRSSVQFLDSGSNAFGAEVDVSNVSGTYLLRLASLRGTNGAGAIVTQAAPFAWATNDEMQILVGPVPITGWSSSVQMSDSASTRVVNFEGNVTTNTALTANVTNIPVTARKDSHGAWNGTQYVVPVSGDYHISIAMSPTTGVDSGFRVWVNGVGRQIISIGIGGSFATGAGLVVNLIAGDLISVRAMTSFTVGASSLSSLTLTRVSGPSAIAASEKVVAVYNTSAGGSVGTSDTLLTFGTREKDSHGCWNGTRFTVPSPGDYEVTAYITTASMTLATTGRLLLTVFVNGVQISNLGRTVGSGGAASYSVGASRIVPNLIPGDYIEIYAISSTATTLGAASTNNYVCIKRV